MANEITATLTLRWARLSAVIQASATDLFTQEGFGAIENIQDIGTVSEAVTFGDVTDPAYLFFKNMDAVNDIHVGTTNPVTALNAQINLKPLKSAYLTSAVAAWYGIADGSTSKLLV